MSACSVILATPEYPDIMALAKALAAIRRAPVQDQVHVAKRAWGIISEHLSEADAGTLVDSLRRAGIECRVVAGEAIAPLPPAETLLKMEAGVADSLALIAAAGYTVVSAVAGTGTEGPKSALKIINAGILLTTGLPIKLGGKERKGTKTHEVSETVYQIDLVGGTPHRRWRVQASHFDYSFLKERKQYQSFANFKLLLGDLVAASPQAWRNRGTQAILSGQPLHTMGYETLADLEREAKWLLTLRSLGGT